MNFQEFFPIFQYFVWYVMFVGPFYKCMYLQIPFMHPPILYSGMFSLFATHTHIRTRGMAFVYYRARFIDHYSSVGRPAQVPFIHTPTVLKFREYLFLVEILWWQHILLLPPPCGAQIPILIPSTITHYIFTHQQLKYCSIHTLFSLFYSPQANHHISYYNWLLTLQT